MPNLRQTIEAHAAKFAEAIVRALREASLDDVLTISGGAQAQRGAGAGAAPRLTRKAEERLTRRTAADIAQTLTQMVAVLAQHPDGLTAEQIKAALQLDKREMPKPIAEGLKSGALKKRGQKRATVYSLGSTNRPAARKKTSKKKSVTKK
jgi:Fic family protein